MNKVNKIQKGSVKNWWYYYKWYLICGIILLAIAMDLLISSLEIGKEKPDYQVAYIAALQLPADTQQALEQALADLGEDLNKDGKVIVQIHQYISGNQEADSDAAYFKYGSEVTLTADINDYESYFFLMENPVELQKREQILALPDGSCPDNFDYSVSGKVYRWSDCPLLAALDLGCYTESAFGNEISGNGQDLLSDLFIGRRCFYNEDKFQYSDECDTLWNKLIHNAKETTPDDFT